MKAYRHGEMVLIPVPETLLSQWEDLFNIAGKIMDDPRIIAEGEITGHKHELTGGQVNSVVLNSDNSIAYNPANSNYVTRRGFLRSLGIGAIAGPVILLKITKATSLKHPEHNTIDVPEGNYVTYAQREYDENTIKRVID